MQLKAVGAPVGWMCVLRQIHEQLSICPDVSGADVVCAMEGKAMFAIAPIRISRTYESRLQTPGSDVNLRVRCARVSSDGMTDRELRGLQRLDPAHDSELGVTFLRVGAWPRVRR